MQTVFDELPDMVNGCKLQSYKDGKALYVHKSFIRGTKTYIRLVQNEDGQFIMSETWRVYETRYDCSTMLGWPSKTMAERLALRQQKHIVKMFA